MSAYWAQNSPNRLLDIVGDPPPNFRSSYLNAVTLSYAYSVGSRVRWELEGQAVRHHGLQDHWETNLLLVARWMPFPWDDILDTRFAYGGGFSYATERPVLEPRSDPEAGESARVLHYLMMELEFTTPGAQRWSGFARIHHRSGMFGLFAGVSGGSNFIGVGLRYRFD